MDKYKILIDNLKELGYFVSPKTPSQLKNLRKNYQDRPALEQFFSLGITKSVEELKLEGLRDEVFDLFDAESSDVKSPFAISGSPEGELFIHSPWPPKENSGYIHLGPESFYIARELKSIENKKVLDLGCGMGVLSFATPTSCTVTGVDLDASAVEMANFYKGYYGRDNIEFMQGDVSLLKINKFQKAYDLVVFNPPLAIPAQTKMVHRDGGFLGIEIPLKFLDLAHFALKPQGEAWFIAGDPLVKGKWMMKNSIDQKKWEIQEYSILEKFFNQGTARKHNYQDLNIDQIDLVLIKVKKLGK